MKDCRTGFILIIVLALLGLLAFIGVAILQASKVEQNLSNSLLIRTKAYLIARSGIEDALIQLNEDLFLSRLEKNKALGPGSLADGKDIYNFLITDNSGRLNINDGIGAGKLELGSSYQANQIDPFDSFENISGQYDSLISGSAFSYYSPSTMLSGPEPGDLVNYHAQGIPKEAHLLFYGGTNPDDTGSLIVLNKQDIEIPLIITEVVFKRPKESISGLCNLRIRRLLNSYGDLHRFLDQIGQPISNGNNYGTGLSYFTDSATEDRIVNAPSYEPDGLGDLIVLNRPQNGYQNMEDIQEILNAWGKAHLSSNYLSDQNFFSISEADLTTVNFEDEQIFRLKKEHGIYGAEKSAACISTQRQEMIGLFELDRFPPDLSDLWAPHKVSPINLNDASSLVRASVFSAIVNPSYLCETSRAIYGCESIDFRLARPAIGVAGHVFQENKILENGVLVPSQKNRFMSYRDSLILSESYQNYRDTVGHILNFDDFQSFLTWHRLNSQFSPVYERSDPMGTYNDDPLHGGFFTEDYVENSLPHFLSCVRRIPGYLGAPSPLLSPYIKTDAKHTNASNGWPSVPPETAFPVTRKVEDFVRRVTLPKVLFLPSGDFFIRSNGTISDQHNQAVAKSTIQATIDAFSTHYFRTQDKFVSITDTSQTTNDILIGPNFINQGISAHQELGFVGLYPVTEPIISGSQIAMDFDESLTPASGTNPPTNPLTDEFLNIPPPHPVLALTSTNTNTLQESQLEGSFADFFSSGADGCDLHPFGGLFLSNLGHGFQTDDLHDNFRDSLYWRLQGSQASPHILMGNSSSVGTLLSNGMAEAWIRIPSIPDIPHQLAGEQPTDNSKFSFVIWNLNFWQHDLIDEYDRPGQIVLTYRKNAQTDRGEFAMRVQLGVKEPPVSGLFAFQAGSIGFELIPYAYVPNGEDPLDIVSFKLLNSESYEDWYKADERYYEAIAELKDQPENAAGTWHRVTAGWNFSRLQDGSDWSEFPYLDKMWLIVHDASNVHSYNYLQNVQQDNFYATQSGNHELNIGESFYHRNDLYNNVYHLFGAEKHQNTEFTPHWRLNSCLDNIRFFFQDIPIENRGFNGIAYDVPYSRYNISSTNIPKWNINLNFLKANTLLSFGTRIYNPKDSKDSHADGPNYPHVSISIDDNLGNPISPILISPNMQNLIFDQTALNGNEQITLKYNDFNIKGTPLNNQSIDVNDGQDNWTEIPWIKEVSIRFQSLTHPNFINWSQR